MSVNQNESTSMNTKNFKKLTKEFIAFLKHLKEYKESYALISLAISIVFTTVWNLICEMIYKAYANYWEIDMQYIMKNNQNILVDFIFILGICICTFLPICRLAIKAQTSKKIRYGVFISCILVFLMSFIGLILSIFLNSKIPFMVAVILLFLSSAFLSLFVPLFFATRIPSNNLSGQNQETSAQDNNTSAVSRGSTRNSALPPNLTRRDIISHIAKGLGIFAVIVFGILVGVYIFSYIYAANNKDFKIIVDDLKNMKINQDYNVILSENDSHYYTAYANFTVDGEGNIINIKIFSNKTEIIAKEDDNVKILKVKAQNVNKL